MKKIIVPSDFSKIAINALEVAAAIAKKTDAEIVLLHVIEMAPSFTKNVERPEYGVYMEKMHTQMEKLRSDARFSNLKMIGEIDVEYGWETIEDKIATYKADLIVMGTEEVDYFDSTKVGEHTKLLLKKAACPVLVIKKKIKNFKLESSIFATNFDNSHFEILKNLQWLLTTSSSKIHVLYVNTPNSFATTRKLEKTFAEQTKKYGIENVELAIYNDIGKADGILNYSDDIHADIIIMPTSGRKGLSYLINGSIAEIVVDNSDRVVMTIHI